MNPVYVVLIYFCIGVPVACIAMWTLDHHVENVRSSDDTIGFELVGMMMMWPVVVFLSCLAVVGWCATHGLAYLYKAIFQRTP